MAENPVEALAEAITRHFGKGNAISFDKRVKALHSDLQARGIRLVPEEADGNQMKAGHGLLRKLHNRLGAAALRLLYREMIDAAPGAKEEEERSPNG